MNYLRKLLLVATLFFLSTAHCIKAQDGLETTLAKLSSTVGKAYIAPVVSAFGSNLNSGWVNIMPSASKLSFALNLKIIGMGSLIPDELKTFFASGDFYFSSSQIDQILQGSGYFPSNPIYTVLKDELINTQFNVTFSGPTVVGKEDEALKVRFPGKSIQASGQTFNLNPYEVIIPEANGKIDWSIFPTGALQLTLGTVLGTNLSIRYFPSISIEDIGKFSFWGIGAIHNVAVWFKNSPPVDIGVGYFVQKLKVGDIIESNAAQFGIYVAKTFGFLISITPYAGLTFESSKTSVAYEYQSNQEINGVPVPKVNINFDVEGNNNSAFVIGFNLKLAAVNINADYKISKTKTASAGLSFGL